MNKDELLALADRCEQARGPERELDARIWCALNGKRYIDHRAVCTAYSQETSETQVDFTEPPRRTRYVSDSHRIPHAKPWTASLDAAMTLVPEGLAWELVYRARLSNFSASVKTEGAYYMCPAATPALALTAACLRAIAARTS